MTKRCTRRYKIPFKVGDKVRNINYCGPFNFKSPH